MDLLRGKGPCQAHWNVGKMIPAQKQHNSVTDILCPAADSFTGHDFTGSGDKDPHGGAIALPQADVGWRGVFHPRKMSSVVQKRDSVQERFCG